MEKSTGIELPESDNDSKSVRPNEQNARVAYDWSISGFP